MKYAPPFHSPGTFAVCYDCNRLTSGRCWRHQNVTVIYPAIVVPSHTFSPYEHVRWP